MSKALEPTFRERSSLPAARARRRRAEIERLGAAQAILTAEGLALTAGEMRWLAAMVRGDVSADERRRRIAARVAPAP
jgi:alkyl sulfatase BDS1-like metallo-beta-lactamase superfamily hydrolase